MNDLDFVDDVHDGFKEAVKTEFFFGYVDADGERVYPNLRELAERHNLKYDRIRRWSSKGDWTERKDELAVKREEALNSDVIKTMKEVNREQLRRLKKIHEVFDKRVEAGQVEVSSSDAMRAMRMERGILQGIHGIAAENTPYLAFMMKCTQLSGKIPDDPERSPLTSEQFLTERSGTPDADE